MNVNLELINKTFKQYNNQFFKKNIYNLGWNFRKKQIPLIKSAKRGVASRELSKKNTLRHTLYSAEGRFLLTMSCSAAKEPNTYFGVLEWQSLLKYPCQPHSMN